MSLLTLPTAPKRALRAGPLLSGSTAVLESLDDVGASAIVAVRPSKTQKALRFAMIVIFWLGLGAFAGVMMR